VMLPTCLRLKVLSLFIKESHPSNAVVRKVALSKIPTTDARRISKLSNAQLEVVGSHKELWLFESLNGATAMDGGIADETMTADC
jgi:hypothetical protein